MEDKTMILLRRQEACPSQNMSLADQIQAMQLNDLSSSYADSRSLARASQQAYRKRRPDAQRRMRYSRNCYICSPPHLRNRRQRLVHHMSLCNDEAYWEKRLADLYHEENVMSMDPVQRFYNHGHMAEVMESIRPRSLNCPSSPLQKGATDVDTDTPTEIETDTSDRLKSSPTAYTVSEDVFEYQSRPTSTGHFHHLLIHPTLIPPTYSISTTPSCAIPVRKSEYGITFTWHLNISGVWELGYGPSSSSFSPPSPSSPPTSKEMGDPYGCTTLPLPFACLCCAPDFGAYACSCADFTDDWISPEDPRATRLLDCMGEGMWIAMREADIEHVAEQEGGGIALVEDVRALERGKKTRITEWAFVRTATRCEGEEWDLVSEISSTGSWRVVDVGCPVDMLM